MTIRGTNGYFGRAKFKAYLAAKPPTAIVGYRRDQGQCPIAWFIMEIEPHAVDVEARDESLQYTRWQSANDYAGHAWPTPAWAQRFIHAIDYPEICSGIPTAVTAKEALRALDDKE